MKTPVHISFTLLLLLITTITTLTFRITLRTHLQSTPTHLPNSTLLKFSSLDLSESKTNQEIEHLLQTTFISHRSISSWRRENHPTYQNRDLNLHTRTGLPPKHFKNWPEFRRILRNWFRNKRFHPHVMLDLVDIVKTPIDIFYYNVGSKGQYPSCAVVGNSGILLKNEHGQLIDSHDAVIRLNNARIKGFGQNVGVKTSISFINSNILHLCARREGCYCHPYGEDVPIVMYICQAAHFMDFTVCNSSTKAPLIVTDARLDVLSARIVKYYSVKRFVEETGRSLEEWAGEHDGSMFHYSSGMEAVMLALGLCGRVSLFGFGKSELATHHYHTNQKAELHLHDYEAEYDFYRDLVENPQVIPFIVDKFKIPPVVMYH